MQTARGKLGNALKGNRLLTAQSPPGGSTVGIMLGYREHLFLHRQQHLLTQNIQQLKQAQRNAGIGSWQYRQGFNWSIEAMSLLGRDGDTPHSSLEQFLRWLHPATVPVHNALCRRCWMAKRHSISARAWRRHKHNRAPG